MSVGSSGDFTDQNFLINVATDKVPGWRLALITGVAEDVDTADGEITIWDSKFRATFLSGSTELFFSSTNAGDTTQVAVVCGIDANFDEVSTTVVLNGQNGVTVGNMVFVNSAVIVSGTVAGDVYVGSESSPTAGVPADAAVLSKIIQGKNVTRNGFFMIPRNHSGMTVAIRGTTDSDAKPAKTRTTVTPFGQPPLQFVSYTLSPGLGQFDFPAPVHSVASDGTTRQLLPGKTIFEFSVIASSNDTEITLGTDIILIDDAALNSTTTVVVH